MSPTPTIYIQLFSFQVFEYFILIMWIHFRVTTIDHIDLFDTKLNIILNNLVSQNIDIAI